MDIVCKHCGRKAEEHHEFEAKMSDGCECNPEDWAYGTVKAVCSEFRPFEEEPDGCQYCEHEEGCHK